MKQYSSLIKQYKVQQYLEPGIGTRRVLRYFKYFLAFFLFLFLFAKWVPVVKGLGQVIAFEPNNRRQMIESPISGRIQKWYVLEGEKVKEGQLIATIVDIDSSRLDRLKNKREATLNKVAALEEQKKHANSHVKRMRELFQNGIESKRVLEVAEMDSLKIESEINQSQVSLQDVESELAKQTNQDIYAPFDGFVMSIFATEQASYIKAGEPIAKLIPNNIQLAVELKMKGRDLALLAEGQRVRLVFEGWPAVQISGWPSLAVGTFPGIISVIDAGDDGKGNFRVIVVPADGSWPKNIIRMGTKSEGWVLMKKVPVWWELWRLFSGVPPIVEN